jgi:hypothetical protein
MIKWLIIQNIYYFLVPINRFLGFKKTFVLVEQVEPETEPEL